MEWAIGLMSGTSLDGIDAALIKSDGNEKCEHHAFLSHPYEAAFRKSLRQLALAQGEHPEREAIETELTERHIKAVHDLLTQAGKTAADICCIGFHGHTLFHAPTPGVAGEGKTLQIGKAARLAEKTGIDVYYDFRSEDVALGGEGAPLVPIYHRALALSTQLERPLAFLNIGGVANITWIGESSEQTLMAFDCGPGNALIDDWMARHSDQAMDKNGDRAAAGQSDKAALAVFLNDDFFLRSPPKSLDRDYFKEFPALLAHRRLSLEDGAATLTAATVACVAAALPQLPKPPKQWIVCGGGRHNATLMRQLSETLKCAVRSADMFGWNGDAVEAEAFAYLALRRRHNLPTTFPGTTAVPEPLSTGVLAQKK